jgi:hypothetical protein
MVFYQRSSLLPGVVVHTSIIPELVRWSQKDFKFKASLCHTVSSRPSWAIKEDPASKKKERKKKLSKVGLSRQITQEVKMERIVVPCRLLLSQC